jgi:CyaY protein
LLPIADACVAPGWLASATLQVMLGDRGAAAHPQPCPTEEDSMSLSEARFHDLVDVIQQKVEDVFDDSGLDVDLENSAGVLTVRFENGSQLILSRQEPIRQLWVAARSGGFHFDYDADSDAWLCDSSDERLGEMLTRITLEQGGEALEFEDI